ncbi:peptidyl-tRNA hydrolase [Candidatus Woesearchaeota archaeon]|nr:peptidyl-tRNA hydrolase [Candidatus Woesearchaeota archaeon]MBU3942109.1 peptidyl-tRNA hydrolase Pth2 [Nanoarchaeota archaeon]
MEYKQVILVREDLKLDKGKMAVQVAHASLEAALRSDKDIVKKWRIKGMKKVVLKVKNKEELFKYKEIAKDNNLKTALITDAGRTAIKPGTITCLAIGPDEEKKIDDVTGTLKMM